MSPSFSSFTSCSFNSISSSGHILYGCRDIGCVPGSSSITNSIACTGGIPGNSSGKTSGNSRTTLTSSINGATPTFRAYNCADPTVERQLYQISALESCVSNTVLDGQSILALYLTSQSMPKMTSMSERGKTTRGEEKMAPWIQICTSGILPADCILELGEAIARGTGNLSRGRSSELAKASDMKEWEAPESNKTVAGTEHTSNLPSTISDDCWASAKVTLFTWSARGWARTNALLGVERGGGGGSRGKRGSVHCGDLCPGLPHLKHVISGLGWPCGAGGLAKGGVERGPCCTGTGGREKGRTTAPSAETADAAAEAVALQPRTWPSCGPSLLNCALSASSSLRNALPQLTPV